MAITIINLTDYPEYDPKPKNTIATAEEFNAQVMKVIENLKFDILKDIKNMSAKNCKEEFGDIVKYDVDGLKIQVSKIPLLSTPSRQHKIELFSWTGKSDKKIKNSVTFGLDFSSFDFIGASVVLNINNNSSKREYSYTKERFGNLDSFRQIESTIIQYIEKSLSALELEIQP